MKRKKKKMKLETPLVTEDEIEKREISLGLGKLVSRCYTNSLNAGWWDSVNINYNRKVRHLIDDILKHPEDDPKKSEVFREIKLRTHEILEVVMNLETQFKGLIVSQKLALIHSEISEALEGDRKNLTDDHLPDRTMFEVELADAIIRIADLAGYTGVDLAGAVMDKIEYNKTREDHKRENRAKDGGKKY